MKKASVRDLRYRFSEVERLLERGEKIEITKRKQVIARLLPVRPAPGRCPDFLARLRGIYGDKTLDVKLYVPDANSAEAARRMQRLSLPVIITPLGELELVNAVQPRLFRKEVRPSEARAATAAFRVDVHNGVFAMLALPEEVFTHARQLAARWTARLGTRSLDIIHVAAAIALRADAFQTFDDRQRKLAKAARLVVA